MCRPIKFSKLVSLISTINFPIEKIENKHEKLIEIVSSDSVCHEKLEDSKFRVKAINDLLKKQKLRSSFAMYIDLYYDAEKDLIMLDYPFYPKK